jgi:DNA replication protein DnaC
LYLDDLGKEDKAYYREEIIGKLLFERHLRSLKTFVTINDNPSDITARYGNHIGDRLPEMFNIIKWEG